MGKDESVRFVCSECGHPSTKWLGRCPDCGAWNSFSEEKISKKQGTNETRGTPAESVFLSKVPYESDFRFDSGIAELDRVLGGGLVRGSAILVGGEPGIGKSTLMLQLLALCSRTRKVLYVSGEESGGQVRQRAERLNLDASQIGFLSETKLESVISVMENEKPQIAVIDSMQTLSSEYFSSSAGSVTQMRGCCQELVSNAKKLGCIIFLIGHVTKEGSIAGPKIVEHMVDTVLYFEQAAMGARIIRSVKNRFGSVDEIGLFMMRSSGLEEVRDPSGFFISEREGDTLPPGIAYSSIVEGSRTFLVEIQALVVDSKSGFGRVYSDRIDSSRVMRICAILERHAGVRLMDKEVYINVAGGIRVSEVSVDLAIAMALWSAYSNKRLPMKMMYIGELSLAGEVRPVNYGTKRVKAASEMGFDSAIIPQSLDVESNMEIKKCQNVREAFKIVS